MTAQPVPEGALYYAETHRRVVVPFDADLRGLTENVIAELSDVLASGITPPPTVHKSRCRVCSLLELCRPQLYARPVLAWRTKMLREILGPGQRKSCSTPSMSPPKVPPCARMAQILRNIELAPADADRLRGLEGEAAALYFSVFDHLIRTPDVALRWTGRSRRPPLDPMNALLSFLYTLLTHDCRSAAEAVGLDPAVGFRHRDRPGRPSLALDLMEELRPVLVDRLALSLINRRQLRAADFETRDGGAVMMTDEARKTVLTAWQERKKEERLHPFLAEKIPFGLVPFVQAQMLARHLRGDLEAYPPLFWK